jgi:O-antigen biosynthesis protein
VCASRFREVDGFDEQYLPVAFQDIDLCLKLARIGYRNLYAPQARLLHYEGSSKRGPDRLPSADELRVFRQRWARFIDNDPYYNLNLTRDASDYSLGPSPARIW